MQFCNCAKLMVWRETIIATCLLLPVLLGMSHLLMTTFESCIFKFQIPLMRSHCLLLQTWPHETFPPVASFTLLDLLNGCDNLYVILFYVK